MSASAIVLTILVLSFLCFVTAWLKPDLIALMVLVSLLLTRVIEPADAFAGFSSFAVMTIAALMVIGEGLRRTGVVQWVARQLERVIRKKFSRLILLNTGIPGVLSGFINIVAAASFFIPVILRLCKKMKVPQSKILLPMACTALIGANLTLIGASHNLVVHSLLERARGVGFGFFEFSAVGAALLAAAMLYIFFVGHRLLPGEKQAPAPTKVPVTADLIDVYHLQDTLFEVWATEELEEKRRSLKDLERGTSSLIRFLAVVREGEQMILEESDFLLEEGDMILLQGDETAVENLADRHAGLVFIGSPKGQEKYPISTTELAEAVVPPRSPAIGGTVADLGLLKEHGLTAIAYYRDRTPRPAFDLELELEEGDGILFYGPRNRMREFDPEKELLIYFKPGKPEVSSRMKKKAPAAALILFVVILAAALGIFPIAVSALVGAVAMILLGIVDLSQIYEAIDWKTLILIAGMYPLGVALNSSGAAEMIGNGMVQGLGDLGPVAVMGGVVLLAMVLTQTMHNAAVAIIVTPVAIGAAETLGSDPGAFCVAVIVACSATFMMPYGHPAPYMVQEPGGYTQGDYMRFGIGLNVLAVAVILLVVPLLWPL